MARNTDRRRLIADAGLTVLALDGARGLTHRAVDEEAKVPAGTTSNYFRTRTALIGGLFARIDERLAPGPSTVRDLTQQPPSRDLFAACIREMVRRLTENSEITLALFELRLEAMRHPEVADQVTEWVRRTFENDVIFMRRAGLPVEGREIALVHYLLDGLLLDRLTTSIDPGTPVDAVIDDVVDRLLDQLGYRLPG